MWVRACALSLSRARSPRLSPDQTRLTHEQNPLRQTNKVCRGTAVTVVAPTAGSEEIANPFLQAADDEGGEPAAAAAAE